MKNEPAVFIVDDNQEVREALQLLMESVGLKVQSFSRPPNFSISSTVHFRVAWCWMSECPV